MAVVLDDAVDGEGETKSDRMMETTRDRILICFAEEARQV